ncbi:MAG: ferrous iron transport protein B [Planctomycetaceae bacterium]
MTNPPSHAAPDQRPLRVALIGNPNTGKSTLFNALSGMRVRTGNYPGVTVEQRVARVQWDGHEIELSDLPGTYSLSPKSPDEMVAVQVLTGCCEEPRPDLIICICNAAALERNLYLATQVLEVGLPVVLCLNMWDSAKSSGVRVDLTALSKKLGVPVVPTSASRREGLTELKHAVIHELTARGGPVQLASDSFGHSLLSTPIQEEVARLSDVLQDASVAREKRCGFLVARSLLDPGGSVELMLTEAAGQKYLIALQESRRRLGEQHLEIPATEASQRYHYIGELLAETQTRTPNSRTRLTDRIDSVLTHRFFGFLICLAVLLLVFSTINWFSAPLSDGVESMLGWISDHVSSSMSPGPLRSLLTEGVINGVGSVIVFLPQICLLFLFIGLLEDCGYMARAAFMMDRFMGILGLSGRSFLPLMSSFACAVPGIMATRVIDDRRDRFVTILIAPLMSCSARLPVYVLMIYTFIPDTQYFGGWLSLQALVLFGMSTLGLVVAIPVAMILRRTLFRGEASPFLLELPDYRVPSVRVVLERVWESGQSFVSRAGTLIFATSVLVWAGGSFPGDQRERYELTAKLEALEASGADPESEELSALTTKLNQVNGDLLRGSVLGRIGQSIEPVFKPLGWDWRIGVGVLASFPAREVVIATLGTIYSLGGDVSEEDEGLRGTLTAATWPDGSPVFSIPVALSIMVFFALCAQCVSTLMVIRRETNSWRWPVFSFVYMTALAWIGAFLTYQIGIRM